MHWDTGIGSWDLSEPLYLGILNLTPDSFSDGGRFLDPEAALAHAHHLAASGAGWLDVGAESTRPGATPLPPKVEWERLEPILERFQQTAYPIPLSLDTRHAEVAARGLARGVAALNDVTGFSDPALLEIARRSTCGLIAMRSRREGETFVMPPYDGPGLGDPTIWIDELKAIRDRLLGAGIAPERILLDPGFGFGTTYADDRALWELLPELPERLDWPKERFCLGLSRKRFVAWQAGDPTCPPSERDAATEDLHAQAFRMGYRVFRTHRLPTPRIRKGQVADVPSVARVQAAALQAAYRGILSAPQLAALTPAHLEAPLMRFLAEADPTTMGLWVLERGGHVLGFVVAGPASVSDPMGTGELYALHVHPSVWHRGHGRALLRFALDHLRALGHPQARLWVAERNARARRFYEALGWEADGATRTMWESGIALRECSYRHRLAS